MTILHLITEAIGRVPGRHSLHALTACAAAALVSVPHAAPRPGRIEGIVHLGAPARASLASGAYAPRRVSQSSTAASGVSDVVVFVRDAPPASGLTVGHARMVQRDEAFEPRVVAITRGSTIDFPNADPFFHNVFSLSRSAPFDLGRYRRGDSRSRVFAQTGLVKVFCHIHSQMSGSIMVFDHPYFTMPLADGRFTIPEVPAGTYRLSAWHERIGETMLPVAIEAGQTTRVEFALPLNSQ